MGACILNISSNEIDSRLQWLSEKSALGDVSTLTMVAGGEPLGTLTEGEDGGEGRGE